MIRAKQILIRVSEDEHRTLATKARAAGVSIPALIRDHLDRIKVAESRMYARLEQLLLARIGNHLEMVAEQCRNHHDRVAVLDIIVRLIAIERELQAWSERRRTVCL